MKTKSKNLSASLEDYLEAIFNIAGKSQVARSKDIAELLGVARSSVTSALHLLAKKQLVNYKPYGYITLTKSGITEAVRIARKHKILKSFFTNILDVDNKVAQEAACKAEHALGPAVISRLLDFTNFIAQNGGDESDLVRRFRKFCSRKSSGKRR